MQIKGISSALFILTFTFTLLPFSYLQADSRKFQPSQSAVKSNSLKHNLSLLSNLEYDQEIRGLKIPAHWLPELKQDLYIGRASIQPAQGKLWSIGWKPALKLENVIFQGSLNELGSMLAQLSRSAHTPVTVEHFSTSDCQGTSAYLVAENGNWEQLTP